MARFRSARMTDNTLVSQVDDFIGELESDICEVFGFELDEDITESAFSLDNSGRLTKDQIRFAKPLSVGQAQGLHVTNTTNSLEAKVQLARIIGGNVLMFGALEPDTLLSSFDEVPGFAVAAVDDGTGKFQLYGMPANSSRMGLCPRGSGNASEYLRADGTWQSVGRPSETVVLTTPVDASTGVNTTFSAGSTEKVQWNQDSFDPQGLHASNDDEIIIVNAGKYLVGAQAIPSPSALDAGYMYMKIYRQRAAADTLWAERSITFDADPTFEQFQVDTVIDCNAGDKLWLEVYYDNGGIADQVYTMPNGIANCNFWAARIS